MRFIAEFELRLDVTEYTRSYRNYVSEKMNILEKKMGEQIAISFHWDVPEKMEAGNYKLEIEAFPMDKWIEFKNRILSHIKICNEHNESVDIVRILQIIKDLESFGKSSGDTITNS